MASRGLHAAAAVLLLLSLGVVAYAQDGAGDMVEIAAVQDPIKKNWTQPCERLTRISGCIECRRGRGKSSPAKASHRCLYCMKDNAMRWSLDNYSYTYFDFFLQKNVTVRANYVTACPTTTASLTTCKKITGVDNCARCWTSSTANNRRAWCTLCRLGYVFDWNFSSKTFGKCLKGTCKQITRNSLCQACLPDATCSFCGQKGGPPGRKYLMPKNALWTNAAYSESMCVTRPMIIRYVKEVNQNNAPPPIPDRCVEIGTDFRCMRCEEFYTLVSGNSRCVRTSTIANRACLVKPPPTAKGKLPYRMYCNSCKTGSQRTWCKTCVFGRSLAGAECSLNCKMLYGIGCASCSRTKCLVIDPLYKSGRR